MVVGSGKAQGFLQVGNIPASADDQASVVHIQPALYCIEDVWQRLLPWGKYTREGRACTRVPLREASGGSHRVGDLAEDLTNPNSAPSRYEGVGDGCWYPPLRKGSVGDLGPDRIIRCR